MNKRDALRLRPGDRVLYGNATQTQRSTITRTGEVRFVTARGGIRVADEKGRESWVACSHVIGRARPDETIE